MAEAVNKFIIPDSFVYVMFEVGLLANIIERIARIVPP